MSVHNTIASDLVIATPNFNIHFIIYFELKALERCDIRVGQFIFVLELGNSIVLAIAINFDFLQHASVVIGTKHKRSKNRLTL